MSSDLDEFLDRVDKWKFKLYKRLKRMTAVQQTAFWKKIREEARARGLTVEEPEQPTKRTAKRVRRTA
jgi:hypothetical protein